MFKYLAHMRQNRSSKMILTGVLAATLIFLSVSAYLDLRSSRNLREIAKAQFNEEQLVIARHIGWQIEREWSFIQKEIEMVAGMISGSTGDFASVLNRLEMPLSRILVNGIYRIDILDHSANKQYSFGHPRRWRAGEMLPELWEEMAAGLKVPGDCFMTPVRSGFGGMRVSITRLTETNHIIVVDLDISAFLDVFLSKIQSGKTGYAWIIDGNGTFLYHPYADFIGESAFSAREERDPDISHRTINFIQENRMLEGHEGTGSYMSGWHRGFTGQVEKLIAYSPITVSTDPYRRWSVAVVAPVSEIEGYINQTYIWRFLFQAIIIVGIIAAGTTILFNEVRWSRTLDEKVAERTEALQKSEEKYRSLVESAEDFIFTLDGNGRFQSMNSFTANFFGGRPEDFIGRDIDVVLSRDSSRKHRKMLQLVYRHERSVRDEFTLGAGDHEIWISANFMPIRDKSGRVESVLCIARDITNEKNLERQLVNTEKLASLGTLAAGVAHEINNPLGVILGFSDLLIRKTSMDTQAYEDLKTIERQGMHCKQIVENLLRFARFGECVENSSDVNAGIREIVNIVAHTLQMAEVRLVTDLTENIPQVRCDPRELQQVFLNLVNNACAAMKGGGTLTLCSAYDRKDKKVIVEVTDTGHGIPREHLDRIFEPFFTTKPEGEGTGLGLAVTYGIITKHGGLIDCRSTSAEAAGPDGNGRGTVFTVKLPVLEKERQWNAES